MNELDDYARGFMDGWRDRAEYARECRLTFEDGIEIGWEAAHRRFRNAIAEACQGMPADATAVVHRLVAVWDRETA